MRGRVATCRPYKPHPYNPGSPGVWFIGPADGYLKPAHLTLPLRVGALSVIYNMVFKKHERVPFCAKGCDTEPLIKSQSLQAYKELIFIH